MFEQMQGRGLCTVCVHVPTCELADHARQPVIQCAQFEGYPPRPAQPIPQRRPNLDNPGRIHTEETGAYRGLCVNCDKRHSCTYPRPSGGVWRCEEYE